jgi:hypothetical protein
MNKTPAATLPARSSEVLRFVTARGKSRFQYKLHSTTNPSLRGAMSNATGCAKRIESLILRRHEYSILLLQA